MTPQERAARLRECAAVIATIPPEEFNLCHWWLPEGMAFDDDRNRMYRVADGPCGCPVGHLVRNGRIHGLRFDSLSRLEDQQVVPPSPAARERIFVLVGSEFGLSYEIAQFMFDQYSYNGRDTSAAAVIRRMEFICGEIERGSL